MKRLMKKSRIIGVDDVIKFKKKVISEWRIVVLSGEGILLEYSTLAKPKGKYYYRIKDSGTGRGYQLLRCRKG